MAAVAGICVAGLLAMQFMTTARLREEVRLLRAEVAEGKNGPIAAVRIPASEASLRDLPHRLAAVEHDMKELLRMGDYLVQNGEAPPSRDYLDKIVARFLDSSTPVQERMSSLAILEHNRHMTDDVVLGAVAWYQGTTNGEVRNHILRRLDNSSNILMKEPLLAELKLEKDDEMRERLLDVVEAFAGDPQADEVMWELAMNDPSVRVRQRALNAFQGDRMTPERLAVFREQAANPQLSLDDRLQALRTLRNYDGAASGVIKDLANMVQTTTDPILRAKLFQAFEGVSDPALTPALITGLQDGNPVIRERAAKALSGFANDEKINQWLQHLMNNDPDPRVQREAYQALENHRRKNSK